MTDRNEIEALKASTRGALGTAAALASLKDRIEAFDPEAGITPEDLEELGRISLAHAVAAQALRGLVETIQSRHTGG